MNKDADRADEAGHLGVRLREGPLSGSPAGSPGDPARRCWLRPSVELFAASDGAVYFLRPGEPEDLVIRNPSDHDRRLLATLREVGLQLERDSLPPELQSLLDAGVLIVSAQPPAKLSRTDHERYARQLPWFAEWCEPTSAQAQLRAAKVVIVGCGGLGCWVLGALACAGVGRFALIDDDVVDLSNLNRQVLYAVADVGAPKVACAERWVERFDPEIEVKAVQAAVAGPEDLLPHLSDASAVVLVADRPPHAIARWSDEACRVARVPLITASQAPPVLRVGPTYVPGRTACFACHERALERRHPLHAELVTAHDQDAPAATTLGPASGVIGSLIAMEVMHLLTGRLPVATEGRAMLLDMRTLQQRWELVDLPACHHAAG